MSSIEILAPAGGREQLTAAVRCGADAVYLGAGGFNARRNAENFGGTLAEAVGYCHARGVQVHVTVNTIVMDHEMDELSRTVEEVAESGADAAIIQDLAVLAQFRDRCPDIKRHASTQMTIHDLDGAKAAADMGFHRVVLSRELTLREIEHICTHCGIETEVFVHGALCMCMSGVCYLSAILGGRSGNRGLCAQPCRLDFHAGNRGHALSLKDMSHIDYINELREAGVSSLKIEGRMKRPEYVAAAVTSCRLAREGREYDKDTLQAVFSRSGFTDGYLTGKRDLDMFGYRSRDDVAAASGVLKELANLYNRERNSVPVNMYFRADRFGSSLTVRSGAENISVAGHVPEAAINRELDAGEVRRSLSKTGGTPFAADEISVEIAPGIAMSASSINQMRRDAFGYLLKKLEAPRRHNVLKTVENVLPEHISNRRELWGRFFKADRLAEKGLDRIILPVDEVLRHREIISKLGDRLIGELPALMFDGDRMHLEDTLLKLQSDGLKSLICGNIYGVRLAGKLGFETIGDFNLNISNSVALREYEKLGLTAATVSIELTMTQIDRLRGELPRGIIAYGRLPLMRFRNCPSKGKRGCGDCKGEPALTDRRHIEFPIECGERRFSSLLNSVPVYIADKRLPQVDFLTLYFTRESAKEAERIIEAYREQAQPWFDRSGGLYFRGVK